MKSLENIPSNSPVFKVSEILILPWPKISTVLGSCAQHETYRVLLFSDESLGTDTRISSSQTGC